MKAMMVAVALLVLGGGKKQEPKAADPNEKAAKAHGGKVWVHGDAIPSESGDALMQWLGSHPATQTVAQKTKDGPWSIHYVAIFRKPAVKGPMTVQFFDKTDPKNLIDQYSPANDAA